MKKKLTQMYFDEEQRKALFKIAQQRTQERGTRVSMAEVAREAVDFFLRSNVSNAKHEVITLEAKPVAHQ